MNLQFGIPFGSAGVIKRRCYAYLNIPPIKVKPGPKATLANEERKQRNRVRQKKATKVSSIEGIEYKDAFEELLRTKSIDRSKLPPVTNYQSISLLYRRKPQT
jgi:hypothetical protein